MAQASGESATSSASGPSTIASPSWPRSAILARIAASSVSGIFSLTFSFAAISAARGRSMPKLRAAWMQYCRICAFAARSGRGMMATSDTNSSLPCVCW